MNEPQFAGLAQTDKPQIDIILPVHNEERVLSTNVRRLNSYLSSSCPSAFRITIVDNGSIDSTCDAAVELALELPLVDAIRLAEAGRGGALRCGWLASSAPVVAYMDIDLSTDLDAFVPMVAPLLDDRADLVIGSRLAPGAAVERGRKRDLISRAYNLLTRSVLGFSVRDAQCGFKAMRRDAAQAILPLVTDNGWFFDTELIALAEWNGLRILELPVTWRDDPDSRVRIVSTVLGDLHGIARLRRSLYNGARLPTGDERHRSEDAGDPRRLEMPGDPAHTVTSAGTDAVAAKTTESMATADPDAQGCLSADAPPQPSPFAPGSDARTPDPQRCRLTHPSNTGGTAAWLAKSDAEPRGENVHKRTRFAPSTRHQPTPPPKDPVSG